MQEGKKRPEEQRKSGKDPKFKGTKAAAVRTGPRSSESKGGPPADMAAPQILLTTNYNSGTMESLVANSTLFTRKSVASLTPFNPASVVRKVHSGTLQEARGRGLGCEQQAGTEMHGLGSQAGTCPHARPASHQLRHTLIRPMTTYQELPATGSANWALVSL